MLFGGGHSSNLHDPAQLGKSLLGKAFEKMTRGRVLVGAALVVGMGVCATRAAGATAIVAGSMESGGFQLAVAGGGSGDTPTVGERLAAEVLGVRIPRADSGEVLGGSAAADTNASESKRALALAPLDFTSGSVGDRGGELRGLQGEPSALDIARMLAPSEDFATLSRGVSGDPIADLPETDKPAPYSDTDDSIPFEDAVPALAALCLPPAGLLLLGFVRRRRRAALARRIKQSFARRGARSARNRYR